MFQKYYDGSVGNGATIDNMAMTKYIMYNIKINTLENKQLYNIVSCSSQKHLRPKQCWNIDSNFYYIIGVLRKRPLCRIVIILKLVLYLILRSCGAIKS